MMELIDKENPEIMLPLLQNFLIDNPDLEQLESQLNPFNVFEALDAVRGELKHSDFLAFLLDPAQTHGLGDLFVRTFLQKAILSNPDPKINISPIDLELWDFDDIEIRREWQNIDILLIDSRNKFAVIVENKIYSSEHSEQLQRYDQIVKKQYPDCKVLKLFLTPERTIPTDESYLPIDYGLVVEILEKILNNQSLAIESDVRTFIRHYTQMLRRHIVNDQLEELCRRIYRKHKSALDLIYEYRPDQQAFLRDILEELIKSVDGLTLIGGSKNYISFKPKEWDIPYLIDENSYWKNILYFEIQNQVNKLQLKLYIGPGPLETRQKLYEIARTSQPLQAYRSLGSKWNTIYMNTFLNAKNYEDSENEELEKIVRQKWAQFIQSDLLGIQKIVKEKVLDKS